MTSSILIRDLDEAQLAWLRDSIPDGVSQNEYLKQIIALAQENTDQIPLFAQAKEPARVYGQVPFKFIDLFAGIGGFRSGLTSVGGDCVFTSEWDKYAAKTYQAWYGDNEVYTDDIRDLPPSDIPDHDVLCAGFPCQPFSLAGVSKKNSLGRAHGFDDAKQGNLFFTILDIVDEKRPPVLFLENVKNLKSHDKGKTWQVIEESLLDRDYVVYHKVINSRHWVPQKRERIFIICFDRRVFGREDQIQFQWPEPEIDHVPVLADILSKSAPDKKYMLSDKLWKYLKDYRAKHEAKGNGFGYGLNTGKDVARTMSARYHKDGSEILIKQRGWKNPRRLTPEEARFLLGYVDKYAALFGHEDGFPQVVSDTQAYRQFGNSVVPLVVEQIAQAITRAMADTISVSNNGCLLKGRAVYEK